MLSINNPLRNTALCFLQIFFVTLASALAAQSVGERVKNDPDFKVYAVIFAVTIRTNSAPVVRFDRVIDAKSGKADPVDVKIPDTYIASAKKKILEKEHKSESDLKRGEFFTYFYYVPGHSNVVSDLNKPLDKQP